MMCSPCSKVLIVDVLRTYIAAAFVLVFCVVLRGATASAQERPPLPYRDDGACPGECCVYRDWFAEKRIRVHRDMRDNSPVVFTVRKGERVDALTGTVVTVKAGIARVTAATALIAYADREFQPPPSSQDKYVTATKGEVLHLLTPLGEGFYTAWFHGVLLGQVKADFLPRFLDSGDELQQGDVEQDPEIVWWAKVRNRRGQIGWTRDTDSFGNQDSCGALQDQ
jgi:hypothetical protein